MIERRTRGGTIGLYDLTEGPCATCLGGVRTPGDPRMIGLVSGVVGGEADGVKFETAICGDCLAEALAILFGRRHVQEGGNLDDLRMDERSLE